MTRTYLLIALLVAAVGAAIFVLPRAADRASAHPASQPTQRQPDPAQRIAAPGVVEAASEEIAVRPEIPGRLIAAPVEEGDRVAPGQVVATLDQSVARAQVEAAQAEVALRQAELTALLNGANQLQKLQVWVAIKEAQSVLAQAQAEYERRVKLFEQGALGHEEVERAASSVTVAQQRLEQALLHRRMTAAPPIATDREHAEAALAAARANLDQARALLAKTTIHAPIAGIVVHKYLHAGETASPEAGPILTIADVSRLRVRAEIDEADIGSVHVGESAYVTAPAYGDKKFTGHVIRIAPALGRKKVSTGDPAERVDTKVLETLVELDQNATLPLGLRVTCYLEASR